MASRYSLTAQIKGKTTFPAMKYIFNQAEPVKI